jgi:tRNA pseudouridine55 synthase
MPNGIVIIDKPQDWTSMDVCAKIRGILHEKRVGHAGTLDPMATGVLPVFVGAATKAVSFAENGKKEYVAGLRLGIETDTQDVTGTVLRSMPVTVEKADVAAALTRFTGEISQLPPMYSAIKINGQKLCDLARKGRQVERKPRPVTIYELELLEGDGADYLLRCVCSKGTYIRTLCHDIGQALGCGGCMSSLRRTMAAGFTLDRAVRIEDVQTQGEAVLSPLDDFFADCPAYRIASPKQDALCRNGNPLPDCGVTNGRYRVYGADGTFLCISRAVSGTLTAEKNFFGA